ncbi:MAG: hypothetical protein C0600_02600 [Ignavibacteria bacterium]|nr:MAG: hypothetical protein C0600_02600 [Ignavibacteria bacterium]
MSDSIDTRKEQGDAMHEPERLLNDLRQMPRVSAPMDFSAHLSRKLEELEQQAALPWWKRFFRSPAHGGFSLPAYAYGAVGAFVVLFVSVYVFNVTDVEQDIQDEMFDTPVEQSEDIEKTEEANETLEIAPTTPQSLLPSDDAAKEVKDATPSPSSDAMERRDAGRLRGSEAPSRAADKSLRSEQDMDAEGLHQKVYAPTVRGFLDEEGPLTPLDSSRTADSLRRLDSLRKLNQARPPKPAKDTR